MTVRNSLHQRVGDAGASTEHGLLRNTETLSKLVVSLDPDTADVACKTIRIFLHERDRVGTVGLKNANRPRRTDAMALQEDHDLADRLLVRPTSRDPLQPDLTDPLDLS